MMEDGILLAHGGGGWLTRKLIDDVIVTHLGNPTLNQLEDSALLEAPCGQLAFTTDSYVVKPLFFKGGDIGRLAVCGTVNDLAMMGAKPAFISLALIIEEGFPMHDLAAIVGSVKTAAEEAGAPVVCGDVKVVEKGAANGLFVNTSGIGVREGASSISSSNAAPGDLVLINGFIGDHGIAVISEREGIEFESPVSSDVAPLWALVSRALNANVEIHSMRDPTRGGVAAALNEIAVASSVRIEVYEESLPVRSEVRWACDMLGFDPLAMANEGKVILICPEASVEAALDAMRRSAYGKNARVIGRVLCRASAPPAAPTQARDTPLVTLRTAIGGSRIIETPYGEELPRIC